MLTHYLINPFHSFYKLIQTKYQSSNVYFRPSHTKCHALWSLHCHRRRKTGQPKQRRSCKCPSCLYRSLPKTTIRIIARRDTTHIDLCRTSKKSPHGRQSLIRLSNAWPNVARKMDTINKIGNRWTHQNRRPCTMQIGRFDQPRASTHSHSIKMQTSRRSSSHDNKIESTCLYQRRYWKESIRNV